MIFLEIKVKVITVFVKAYVDKIVVRVDFKEVVD